MNDCVNGDIRDLLPELLNGGLGIDETLRVQDHVRACADCAAEVELLRSARAAMRFAPPMDTTRIAAGVQASTSRRLAARRIPARAVSTGRMAALSLVVALGAIGLWVARDSSGGSSVSSVTVATSGSAKAVLPVPATQLALGGDMSQLEDDQLVALMGELAKLEALPGAEPSPLAIEPVVPVDDTEEL